MDKELTRMDLNMLERHIDAVFARVGINVEFTKHFLDRLNDVRNKSQITIKELGMLFAKEYRKWGKPIADMGDNAQAVMKDMESDINIPFILKWNVQKKELELVAKTVMRKKNFKTQDREFQVEGAAIDSVVNTAKGIYNTSKKAYKLVPKPLRKVAMKVAPKLAGPFAVISLASDAYDAANWAVSNSVPPTNNNRIGDPRNAYTGTANNLPAVGPKTNGKSNQKRVLEDESQLVIVPGVGRYSIDTLTKQVTDMLTELAEMSIDGDPYRLEQIQHKLNSNMLQLKLDALINAHAKPAAKRKKKKSNTNVVTTEDVRTLYDNFINENIHSREEMFIHAAFKDLSDQMQHDPDNKMDHLYDTYRSFNMPISLSKFKKLFNIWQRTGTISDTWITEHKLYIDRAINESN